MRSLVGKALCNKLMGWPIDHAYILPRTLTMAQEAVNRQARKLLIAGLSTSVKP